MKTLLPQFKKNHNIWALRELLTKRLHDSLYPHLNYQLTSPTLPVVELVLSLSHDMNKILLKKLWKMEKQAGVELCQAQVKVDDKDDKVEAVVAV